MRGSRSRGGAAVVLWLSFGVCVAGCGEGGSPTAPSTHEPAPLANSPINLLRLLEWSYDHRSIERYEEFFTDDFRGACAPFDSSSASPAWTREDELISARHLFVGGDPDAPPAFSIQLTLDQSRLAEPDPEYSASDANGRWHRRIRTAVNLQVLTPGPSATEIRGAAAFHLVRGDSAVIPADLVARGFTPDSARWYIRRWDDETGPGPQPALAAQPASNRTLCQRKAIYR